VLETCWVCNPEAGVSAAWLCNPEAETTAGYVLRTPLAGTAIALLTLWWEQLLAL
jgi:hypothetical protein